MSLRKQMAHGALWSLLEKVGQQGLSFLIFMVLARMVGPEEFGLVNLCYVYTILAYTVVFGLVDGIISLRLRDDRSLSTLFWGVLGIGCLFSILGVFLAGPYATIAGDGRIAPLLQWISIVPLLLAAQTVPTMLVSASMNFRAYSIRTLVSTFVSGIVGISMAYKGFGAYALVGQQIVLNLVMNLIIWPSCGWRPRMIFDRTVLSEILAPGLKMTGSSFVRFLEQQMPRLLIGNFLGPVSVGYFAFVARFRQALYDVLMHPMAVVIYPAFSKIKDDHKEQLAILHQIIIITGSLVFPAVAGAIATADIFVPLFFGKAWSPAVPVLQLLLITGAVSPFFILLRDVLRAHNKTGDYLRFQIVLVVLTLSATFILSPHGLIPLSWGLVFLSLVAIPVFIYSIKRSTQISLWKSFGKLWAPAASSSTMVVAIKMFGLTPFRPSSDLAYLVVEVMLGAIVYLIACFITQPKEMKNMHKLLKRLLLKRQPSKGI